METSRIAHEKFTAEGKKADHHKLILNTLNGSVLTAYGISIWSGLDRVQVSRRTSELERLGLIEKAGRHRDPDGALRTAYKAL